MEKKQYQLISNINHNVDKTMDDINKKINYWNFYTNLSIFDFKYLTKN